MSRKFIPITANELQTKIVCAFPDGVDLDDIREQFGKDIKVAFDGENFECGLGKFYTRYDNDLTGLQTLENGLTFCGMYGGGDWENPVFFIVYWDGKRLRAYVPTDGNTWNTDTKQAYGNDPEADFKNAKKRWPDTFANYSDEDAAEFDEFSASGKINAQRIAY